MSSSRYNSRAWQKLSADRRRIAEADQEPCRFCGKPINYADRSKRGDAATVDHIIPLAAGGEMLPAIEELGMAHRKCNGAAGGLLGVAIKEQRRRVTMTRDTTQKVTAPSDTTQKVTGNDSAFFSDRHAYPSPTFKNPPLEHLSDVEPIPDSLLPALSSIVRDPPVAANMPRVFSAQHPDAVSSLGPVAIEWIENVRQVTLRWAQKVTLLRAMEVDSSGEFCWRDVVMLQPRRGGKTVLMRELAIWRAAHAGLFGGPQTIVHMAQSMEPAREVMEDLWDEYCVDEGLKVSRSNSRASITWPDRSSWRIKAHKAAFGSGSDLVVVDESWALEPDRIERALEPTMLGRNMPQIWFFSMANDDATALVHGRRRLAVDPANRVMLAEWSADRSVDVTDVGECLACIPHVSDEIVREYELLVRRQNPAWRTQYLNQWPELAGSGSRSWPVGWDKCERVDGGPPPGGVGALEASFDRRFFSVSLVVEVGGEFRLWSKRFGSQDEAVRVLAGWCPSRVLVGASLGGHVSVPFDVELAGGRETRAGSAEFGDVVRRGRLLHDHDPDLLAQVLLARVAVGDFGLSLSARLSGGPTDQLRSAIWAVHALSVPVVEEAAIV